MSAIAISKRLAPLVLSLALLAPAAAIEPAHPLENAGEPVRAGALETARTIEPGQELALGGRRLLLGLERPARGALVTSLFVRHADGRGRARLGTIERHLDVRYALRDEARQLRAEGRLEPRLTAEGPAYRARIELAPRLVDALDAGLLSLELTSAPREVGYERTPRGEDHLLHARLIASLDPEALGSPDAGAPSAMSGSGGVDEELDPDALRLRLVSSLDPHPAEDYSDIWGWSDGTTYLAIMGVFDGTSFVDVTDPANPVEVAFIPGPGSSWRDMKTFGNYAYIGTEGLDGGIQVVDLTNPLAPTLVNTYLDTLNTSHNVYLETTRGLLYVVGADTGTRILDVASDPANPVEVGSWNERYVHDAFVLLDNAYFAEVNDGLAEVLDASDPANLQVRETWVTPEAFTHNIWTDPEERVAVTTDEVTGAPIGVYDIEDLAAPGPPELVSIYQPNDRTIPHNAIFDDEDPAKVTVSHYGIGLQIFDVGEPRVPIEIASYDTHPEGDTGFVGAWGVYPFDDRGYIYVSDIERGLLVFEEEPTGGPVTGSVRDATSGEPVAGASLVALEGGEETSARPDGLFGFYVSAGEVRLLVSAPGYGGRVVEAGSLDPGGRLRVDVELVPLPSASVSGSVLSAESGDPLAGVRVAIPELGAETTSDAAGLFTLPDVAVGGRRVVAGGGEWAEGALEVLVGGAGLSDLVFELDPAFFYDDVESDLGWSLGLPEDTAGSGEWTRVDPNGTGGGQIQPEDDATPAPGVVAFITGQSAPGASAEANDVEGGLTTLESPLIDASGAALARLEYRRWVSTEGGAFGGGGSFAARVASGASPFETLESTTRDEPAWSLAVFPLDQFVSLADPLRVRFVCSATTSFGGFRVLECGVDEVRVVPGCDARFNPEALDADGDARADACDPCPNDARDDEDGDGLCADVDNAPSIANPEQLDQDADGVGDVADNCLETSNPAQRDLDGDGLGDACDEDVDGDGELGVFDVDSDDDGIDDDVDVCPNVPDARQRDADLDGEGDACDADDGRVAGLRFEALGLAWDPEQGAAGYELYRGRLGDAALVPLARCLLARVADERASDPEAPQAGEGWFYLVAVDETTGGGPLGRNAAGEERTIEERCP